MRFNISLAFAFLFTFYFCFSQEIKQPILLNNNSKTYFEIEKTWNDFLLKNKDVSQFESKLLLPQLEILGQFRSTDFLTSYQSTVLSISQNSDSIFTTQVLFTSTSPNNCEEPIIIRVPVEVKNGSSKIYEPFGYNLSNWKQFTQNEISFIVPPNFQINTTQLDSTFSFCKKLGDLLQLDAIPFTYIVFENQDDMWKKRGFDYQKIHLNRSMAIGDQYVFSSSNSLFDGHEIAHIYINRKTNFSNNKWFHEGFASFLGGHRNKPLKYYYTELLETLKNDPSINLNNLLSYKKADDWADYRYIIGGLFCQIVYDKDGIEKVIEMLQIPQNDTSMYAAIEQFLGIKRENLHTYIVENLAFYAAK